MAQGPRAQSHGAWLRAAGQDQGSSVHQKLDSRARDLVQNRVGGNRARRLRAAAGHGSGAEPPERGVPVRVRAPRKPLLGATCCRPRLRRLRLWQWMKQWPPRPSPPGLDRTALARGPGQPITQAPEARPLLFPAPLQLRRKGSEVQKLKARTRGLPSSHRAKGALLWVLQRLWPTLPSTLLQKIKAGLSALLYSQNSLYNSPVHTWVKTGGSG